MKPPKIEIVGLVLAVERDDELANRASADPSIDEHGEMFDRFAALGFDVQAVSLHVDGMFRIEVLS